MPVGLKRAVVSIAALALALPLAAQAPARAEPLVAAAAASAPASRTFTSTIDPYAQYLGQTLCSPTSKPGLLKVADLLRATYGPHDIGITRPCSDGGVSEHKEGRALDWMVNRRVKAERQQANAFLAWLLADDEFGNPDAMARRLGVMYIGWDDRMWRSYDPNRGTNGWDDLKGCTTNDAMKATSYDTYCHRNHVHLSFSWDGADGDDVVLDRQAGQHPRLRVVLPDRRRPLGRDPHGGTGPARHRYRCRHRCRYAVPAGCRAVVR